MCDRRRTIATEAWCKTKKIDIDQKIIGKDVRGVYGFFIQYPEGEHCVYIGKAINVEARVYEHFSLVKWQEMGMLKTAPFEYVKELSKAINLEHRIVVKLLKEVKYKYDDYYRELHRLAFCEYC